MMDPGCGVRPSAAFLLGDTGSFSTEQDAVFLIPRELWWACAWWLGHPEVELYVDICTPSEWEQDRVMNVDLDLDVIRFLDGRVEIDDRDEFEVHSVEYGYPAAVIDGANRAAADVFDRISRKEVAVRRICRKRVGEESPFHHT